NAQDNTLVRSINRVVLPRRFVPVGRKANRSSARFRAGPLTVPTRTRSRRRHLLKEPFSSLPIAPSGRKESPGAYPSIDATLCLELSRGLSSPARSYVPRLAKSAQAWRLYRATKLFSSKLIRSRATCPRNVEART